MLPAARPLTPASWAFWVGDGRQRFTGQVKPTSSREKQECSPGAARGRHFQEFHAKWRVKTDVGRGAAGRPGPFLTLELHSDSSSLEELLIDNKQHLSTSSGDVTGGTGGLPTPPTDAWLPLQQLRELKKMA